MSDGFGATLKQSREERGLTLDAVSRATRIPVQHLQALEDDHPERIPEGPYYDAYMRAYCALLELDLPDDVVVLPSEPAIIPLWGVRLIAGTLALTTFALVGWQVYHRSMPQLPESQVVPDQIVKLKARKTTAVTIEVDGETVFVGELAGGEEREVKGHSRVEVRLSAAADVRVQYNGDVIVPLGRQDAPRRLVFIDDVGPEPQ